MTDDSALRAYIESHCLVCGEFVDYECDGRKLDLDDPLAWPCHFACSDDGESMWAAAGRWAVRALQVERENRELQARLHALSKTHAMFCRACGQYVIDQSLPLCDRCGKTWKKGGPR